MCHIHKRFVWYILASRPNQIRPIKPGLVVVQKQLSFTEPPMTLRRMMLILSKKPSSRTSMTNQIPLGPSEAISDNIARLFRRADPSPQDASGAVNRPITSTLPQFDAIHHISDHSMHHP